MAKKRVKKNGRGAKPRMLCILACDTMSRDQVSFKITLHGLFDIIRIDNIPSIIPAFIFSEIFGGNGECEVFIKAFGPDGKQIAVSTPIHGKMRPDEVMNVGVQFSAVPLLDFGKIKFIVEIDGNKVGWPLEISVINAKKKS